MFGEYVDGKLDYVHYAGGGYTAKEKADLYKRFKKLEISSCPFRNKSAIEIDTLCHWVKPELIGEFEISNKTTRTGHIRHPAIFKSLREDKKPLDVIPDVVVIPNLKDAIMKGVHSIRQRSSSVQPVKVIEATSSSGSWELLDKERITSEEVFEVEGLL